LDYLTNINKLKIATNVVLELQLDVLWERKLKGKSLYVVM
jgi:hypothetical protein